MKGRRQYNRTTHRLREVERIISHRHGRIIPETDDVDIYFEQVADCLLHMQWKKTLRWLSLEDLADRVKLWCERWAPWASILLFRDTAREALRRKRVDSADECAARLRLSYEERSRLRITTIGSFDVNKRQRAKLRKERKRIRDRERQARKRAERGVVPRAEYLARSLTRTQPWRSLGIHRRTWKRRRRATQPSVSGLVRRQHDRASRHWPRAGRAAGPKLRHASTTAKRRGGRAKPDQTLPINDASQSPSNKKVLVGDPPASISIEIAANEETNDERPI
jgi:hypothetical protein